MLCRVCDSARLEPIIDLGLQPWGNHFLKKEEIGQEPFYPLRVVYCLDCQTAQLDYTVKKEVMFSNHTYLSGVTKSLRDHFDRLAFEVYETFLKEKIQPKILDIGSNDGSQLASYKKLGCTVLGVDSSKKTVEIANQNGIPTLHNYFNLELAKTLEDRFDVINASGVFFHLEELHSVTQGIKHVLAPEGVFVVQFIYMKGMIENCAFDQIYHEHLLYYNLKTIEILLNRHGLALFDAYLSPIHGGSIIGFVTHQGSKKPSERLLEMRKQEDICKSNEKETYLDFAKRIEKMKKANLEFLLAKKSENKKIYGMGAPVKGNTLLNYFGVDGSLLECLVEKNELRKDLYAPGSHLPIRIEKELSSPPDVYYVLAWNFKREILENNQDLIRKGVEFYFPVDLEVT